MEESIIENHILTLQKDLPQLIVALDSTDKSANYIHIADAKENTNYYCPCCKGLIKPRAYKKNINYQVQPHYYHETGGCSEESFVHYICKTWLFEKGCKFKIDRTEYTVLSIETEKTLHTSFGDYRPDIVVNTEVGKTFFFEIKYSNRKTELYAPKWDELGNDVVEVDAREFINNKHDCSVPEFKLIYSDGECFIKTYSRIDYEDTIARRKLEWKRQDKLNYKIQWERLDWFWNKLQKSSSNEIDESAVIEAFRIMDYEDRVWCYLNISGKSCTSFKEQFKSIINNSFVERIISVKNNLAEVKQNIKVNCIHISPMIYDVTYFITFSFSGYQCSEKICVKYKSKKGIFFCETEEIKKSLITLNSNYKSIKDKLVQIEELKLLKYVKSIKPCSQYQCDSYNFSELYIDISYCDNIHNKILKEEIGRETQPLKSINKAHIESMYNQFKQQSWQELNCLFMASALKHNSYYQKCLQELKDYCVDRECFDLRVSSDYRRVWLLYLPNPFQKKEICSYEFKLTDKFDQIGDKIFKIFKDKVQEFIKKLEIIDEYVNIVRNSKNKLWDLSYRYTCFNDIELVLTLNKDVEDIISLDLTNDIITDDSIKEKIYSKMKQLISIEYRIMEVR